MNKTLETLGPGIWKIIHRITYLHHRGVLSTRRLNTMLVIIISNIPCSKCVSKSHEFHNATMNNGNSFTSWWIHHNDVNTSRGVRTVSLESVLSKAKRKATTTEKPGLDHIFLNTNNRQLRRLIHKLL
jgi:hypothetical protein